MTYDVGLIGSTLVFLSTQVSAAADAQESGGGDIMDGSLMTSIFALIVFALLLAILAKYAWGPILASLQKREDHIRQSIENAEKAREDAEKALQDYQEQLAQARAESQAIIDKGRSDATQLAVTLKNQAKNEAQSLRDRAQQDIASAKNQALREIYDQVTNLATDMAGRIVQKSLTADDHRQLLQESLDKLDGSPS